MPDSENMYDDSATQDSAAGGGTPPATPAADASPAPGQQVATATPAPAATPVTTAPTSTPKENAVKDESWGTKVYHGVLNALGGGGDVAYSRDQKTGQMVATPVKTGTGAQWKKIIAGALTGFGAAAAAGTRGPGGALRGAGAGINAGINLARRTDAEKRGNADEDFEAGQKAALQNAQVALLSGQIAKSTFDLGRAQVTGSVEDSERESNFTKVIGDGGDGSADMGVFPDFQSVMKAFQEVPELHDHQAGGRIITIPHINAKGQVDGIHAALVTPDWLSSKVNRDLPITVNTYKDGKLEQNTFTVPAGSLTGLQYSNMVMAQSKDALEDWTKVADEKNKADQLKNQTSRTAAENAQSYADADKDHAEALLDQAKSASAGTDVDWGPGGEKGFNSWHDKNVTPALGSERTYRLASDVYNEYQQLRAKGKDFPAGAQSVQMLSYHMANTFGNVKGARITKDLIAKHMGARSISDSALVAIQKITNGDQLSPSQWDAYFSLVGQNRNETWRGVLDDAQALGRPLEYIAFPKDLRQRWGLGQGRVSLDQKQPTTGTATVSTTGLTTSATPPAGATHQAPGNDGKTYWTDDKGKVLGIKP